MLIDTELFQKNLGLTIPQDLIDFFCSGVLEEASPITFHLKNISFIIEIQYFLDITNIKVDGLKNGKLPFAVTSDGYELLIDLSNEKLEIFQDEYGDLDSLGISIKDMNEALECN